MTDLTPRVTSIAFEVEARAKVRWTSQGLGDTRSCGLHVISPPHTAFLRPPHRSALTTPDPTPWTSLYRIEYSHENPSQNAPQRPQATWPLIKIMWASCDDRITMRHRVSRSLSQWPWDLRVPTLFFFNLFLSYGVLMLFWLLHSAHTRTCSRSQLGGHLYASLCPVRIPVFSTSMQTAALVTDALRTSS